MVWKWWYRVVSFFPKSAQFQSCDRVSNKKKSVRKRCGRKNCRKKRNEKKKKEMRRGRRKKWEEEEERNEKRKKTRFCREETFVEKKNVRRSTEEIIKGIMSDESAKSVRSDSELMRTENDAIMSLWGLLFCLVSKSRRWTFFVLFKIMEKIEWMKIEEKIEWMKIEEKIEWMKIKAEKDVLEKYKWLQTSVLQDWCVLF